MWNVNGEEKCGKKLIKSERVECSKFADTSK